jgi:TPR repeat protein
MILSVATTAASNNPNTAPAAPIPAMIRIPNIAEAPESTLKDKSWFPLDGLFPIDSFHVDEFDANEDDLDLHSPPHTFNPPPKSDITPHQNQWTQQRVVPAAATPAPSILSDPALLYNSHGGPKLHQHVPHAVDPAPDDLATMRETITGLHSRIDLLNTQLSAIHNQALGDNPTPHDESPHLTQAQTLSKEISSAIPTLQGAMVLHGRLIQYQPLQNELDAFRNQMDDILTQLQLASETKLNLMRSTVLSHEDEITLAQIKTQKTRCSQELDQCKSTILEKELDLAPARQLIVFGLADTASVHDKIVHQEAIVDTLKAAIETKLETLTQRIGLLSAQLALYNALQRCHKAYAAKDYATVLQFVHQFAPHKNPDALYYQGALHYRGRFTHPSTTTPSTSSDNASRGVAPSGQPDYQGAHDSWLEAANLGHPLAQYRLALLLQVSKLGPPDFLGAHQWLTQAAQAGQMDSQFRLAMGYKQGRFDAGPNYPVARDWFAQAAEQGHDRAQFELGSLYQSAHLGVPNYGVARDCFIKAAEQGHDDAQNHLGRLYYSNQLGPPDYQAALKWFTKAAEQGHADAQNNLGSLYQSGDLGAPNYNAACHWYTLAAKQGNSHSQYALGCLYESTDLGVPDYPTALKWFTKAADQGHAFAKQSRLSLQFRGFGAHL